MKSKQTKKRKRQKNQEKLIKKAFLLEFFHLLSSTCYGSIFYCPIPVVRVRVKFSGFASPRTRS